MTSNDPVQPSPEDDRLEEIQEKQRVPDRTRLTSTRPDPQELVLKALARGDSGADFDVLGVLMNLVVSGKEIRPDFQRVANAIVAQSVLRGKLPTKPIGRPRDQDNDVCGTVAIHYYSLRDAGTSYSDAVSEIAALLHKDERHIMRLVKRGKRYAGATMKEREAMREFFRRLGPATALIKYGDREPFHKITEAARVREFIGKLDDLIDAELDRMNFTDMKSP